MKKVVILQKYLAPYRVPLFNGIAEFPDIELTLLYYGKLEARRKWGTFANRKFSEIQSRCFSVSAGYERNLELPHSLLSDLERIRPDVIICAPDIGGVAAAIYSRRNAARYSIWSEATPVTEKTVSFLKGHMRNSLYKNADCFIVPGELSEKYIRSYCPSAEVHFAPNTIEEKRFSISAEDLNRKFDKERLTITFSGSLVERKGILLLLEAFTNLMSVRPELRSKCMLRILGTGPLDLSNFKTTNIEIAGFCEQQTYADFFMESHVFILPSLHDNNPLTVVEGLFAGNAIIVSDGVGNYPEAVHGNGYVVPSNSVAEIAGILEKIIALTRKELLRMACESTVIARQFSVERSVNGFLSAILSCQPDSDGFVRKVV